MSHEPCKKVIAMESRVETRHKLMMWFLGVVGGCIILTVTLAISVGSDISTTLLKVSNTQAKLSTTLQNITSEVRGLRAWRIATLESHTPVNTKTN